MTSTVIKPTVGRKVWYRPSKYDQQGPVPMQCAVGQPLDATVIAVHGDRCVNVLVTDMVGRQFPVLSVTLVHDGETPPADGEGVPFGRYVEWMPYQKGQAAKDASSALPVVDPGPDSLEREIQAKANKGPRVTPADVEAEISAEYSFTLDKALAGCPLFDGSDRVTIAVLVLKNGAKLVGVNYGAIDPAQHSPEMGAKEARAAAVEQIWPLLGFRLRDELARPVLTDADAAADLAGAPRPDNPTAEAADFLASVKACDLSGDAPCEACQ
jgi:hypothetical protein